MIERLDGPPVVVLGGDEIGLSVARSLGRRGVHVWAIAASYQPIRYSRYVDWIRAPEGSWTDFWRHCAEFLTGPHSDHLAGSLLLAASDEALALLTDHRPALEKKFLLDRSNPQAQRTMLDKVATYEAAKEAGVPTPRFWVLQTQEELRKISNELSYPLIVKPRHGHLFKARFRGKKHIVANRLEDVESALDIMREERLEAFLVETIPGPDDQLCSYYTYLDETGRAYFDFTKRIIRRFPKNMGQATYHITDDVPGLKEPALRLFRHVGLQGVANVEFKWDGRDGQYKLIECNARFTGGNPLVMRSGVNIAELVYRDAAGLPPKEIPGFRTGIRMWHPRRDFAAYRELQRLGELNFLQWAGSVLHPQTFALWSWRDPGPSIYPKLNTLAHRLRRR